MAWPTKDVQSWDDFTKCVDECWHYIATSKAMRFIFRGQADSTWSLVPSLARLTNENAFELEQAGLEAFKLQAHLFLSDHILRTTTDPLAWWSLIQHYRAPTRLLDWTPSPYVAAYFAVEDHWEKDGVIWMANVAHINAGMSRKYPDAKTEYSEQDFSNPGSPPRMFVITRMQNTDRMIAQQGAFTVCLQPLCDHAEIIADTQPPGEKPHRKLVIPSRLKPEFLQRLRTMNIAAHSLFPGIDGLGRSVSELLRLGGVAMWA
jgi:hypothetical protein